MPSKNRLLTTIAPRRGEETRDSARGVGKACTDGVSPADPLLGQIQLGQPGLAEFDEFLSEVLAREHLALEPVIRRDGHRSARTRARHDQRSNDGIIGPPDGSKPREVLKSPDWIREVEHV